MKCALVLTTVLLFVGCNKTSNNPVLAAILAPVTAVGCSAENSAIGWGATTLNAQCGAPIASATACLRAVIGNAYLCSASVSAQMSRVQPKGLVANVLCPIAVPFFMGLMTATVPASCGCTTTITAPAFQSGLLAACELAPI